MGFVLHYAASLLGALDGPEEEIDNMNYAITERAFSRWLLMPLSKARQVQIVEGGPMVI